MSGATLSILPVLVPIALITAGCAAPLAPEAQCFAEATVEYRVAWRAAEMIRADLDRGYGLHPVEFRGVGTVPCRIEGVRANCLHQTGRTEHLPVAIDRAALIRRLAALEMRMDRQRPAAMARAAPCGFDDLLAEGRPLRGRP